MGREAASVTQGFLAPAACLRFKSPEMAEQRKMAVARAVEAASGHAAGKQAFSADEHSSEEWAHWAEHRAIKPGWGGPCS